MTIAMQRTTELILPMVRQYATVITDMEMQGNNTPMDLGFFHENAILQEKLFVLVVMMDGSFVQPIHLFIKYVVPGHRLNQYAVECLLAIGDHKGMADPPYAKVKKSYFE